MKIRSFFETIISGEEVKNKKPHPEAYNKALKAMNLSPNQAVIIEDSKPGLEAGNKAKVPVIVIPTKITKENDLSKASHIIRTLHLIKESTLAGITHA